MFVCQLRSLPTIILSKPRCPEGAKNARSIKLLIYGTLTDIPFDRYEAVLRQQGSSFISIAFLTRRNFTANRTVPIGTSSVRIRISLVSVPHAEAFYKLSRLLFFDVMVTPFLQQSTGQCENCLGCGHSSISCTLSSKYVRCDGSHCSILCTTSLVELPGCVNCKWAHTGNYRDCPVYDATLRSKKKSISVLSLKFLWQYSHTSYFFHLSLCN